MPSRIIALTLMIVSTTVLVRAQYTSPGAFVGPFSDAPKFHAPFSAEATTTVSQATAGGPAARESKALYFRDSAGRVRVEYEDGDGHRLALLVPNPYAKRDRAYEVDDVRHTVALSDYGTYGAAFNAGNSLGVPIGTRRFAIFYTVDLHQGGNGTLNDLGERMIDGLRARGTSFQASPSGAIDERWESPDLGIVLAARHTDPEKGVSITYRLTDLRREEPASRLFVIPPDYTFQGEWSVRLEQKLPQ
jgi:hypothetical protein